MTVRKHTRALAVSISASIALHVFVLFAFPSIASHENASVEVLQVTLVTQPEVKPQPPRAVAAAREPPRERLIRPPAPRRAKQRALEREEKTNRFEAARAPPTPAPEVLALPQPAPEAVPVFTTPAPQSRSAEDASRIASSRGAAPAAASRGTEAPAAEKTTPPSFNARYLRNPPPRYPVSARRNGEQGTVTLKVLVTREGLPGSVTVQATSGSAHLDRAALEAVKSWKFVPARQGAQPVDAWVLVPVVFRLESS